MKQRDIDLLSSYLDGQLKPSDSARLEARLSTDPNLRLVLDDLRATRGLLRRLPMRKAPRNFTLTPKMVGKNPPLPRAYPAFRFMTALASLLLFFTLGLNFLAPQLASPGPGFGMGGGGAPDVYSAQAPAATEAPAISEAPAAAAPAPTTLPVTEAPAEPSLEMVPQPTATLAVQDTAREAVTTVEKSAATAEAGVQNQEPLQNPPAPQANTAPHVSFVWQILLAGIALAGAFIMLMMRRLAVDRWRRKS